MGIMPGAPCCFDDVVAVSVAVGAAVVDDVAVGCCCCGNQPISKDSKDFVCCW